MNLKIYIAGSSQELARVDYWMCACLAGDIQITRDWTADIRANPEGDGSLRFAQAYGYAQQSLDAIEAADMFWLLWPKEPTKGAFVEFGYALATCRMTVISGSGSTASIFATQATCVWATDEGAFGFVRAELDRRLGLV